MTTLRNALVFFCFLVSVMAQNDEPWAQPRDFARFQFLLDRSPFSLPTAEESSPVADRYTLTGAISINGDPSVFVLDKTTQERHMLSKTPNKLDMALVDYMPDPDPRRMHATIKISGQLATISYSEPVAVQGQQQPVPQIPGQAPQNPNPSAVVNPPPGQVLAGAAPQNMQQPSNTQSPQRRIIRRRIISGQPGSGP